MPGVGVPGVSSFHPRTRGMNCHQNYTTTGWRTANALRIAEGVCFQSDKIVQAGRWIHSPVSINCLAA